MSCIGGSLGGAILGFMGSNVYMIGGLGIFGIPGYIGPNGMDKGFYGSIIAMIAGFLIGFILMLFTKLEDDVASSKSKNDSNTANHLVKQEILVSPVKGEVKPLSEVKDEAFSKGALGKGIAIEPKEGKIVSPVDGVLTTFFSQQLMLWELQVITVQKY